MEKKPHFLVVTYPAQSHINPALHLANRLAHSAGARVTFSTAISAHRRMFPTTTTTPDQEVEDGLISFLPFSDGYDNGFKSGTDDINDYMSTSKLAAFNSFSSLVDSLVARRRPVTCIIYTLLLSWAADVANDHGIPSAQFWIQRATVFAIYYHYFHGYGDLISDQCKDPLFTINLPGLPPLQIRDLPSFLTNSNSDDPYSVILTSFRNSFESLDKQLPKITKPKILVNTFDDLESDALAAVETVDLIAIGPIQPSNMYSAVGDLKEEDEMRYTEWLDSKAERSVVYVSFGSISVVKKEQMDELSKGLRERGRPYLWVVRKDSRWEGIELEEEGGNGMVVEWCSQVRVLSHRSVSCFVTHCGWNSTAESLVSGVPIVGVPQWTDQRTNARLAEEWGTGVRAEVNKEGVVEGGELRRCLDLVMGEGGRGVEIRRKAEMWRVKAREAIGGGGSSDRNLRAFVEEITKLDGSCC